MSGNGHKGPFELVVVAASFGGLKAFQQLLAALPPDFAAPLVFVQHRDPSADYLASLLQLRTSLVVAYPAEGTRPAPGTVYVAPADRQLLLDRERRFAYADAPRTRADALLESAAAAYGAGVISVILTGRLKDGTHGVRAVKGAGGRVLVQDEATSAAREMPGAAVATGCADFVLPLDGIGPALISLVMVPGAADLFAVRLSPWAALDGGGLASRRVGRRRLWQAARPATGS